MIIWLMVEDFGTQPEGQQDTSEVEVEESRFTTPPRWREKLKANKFKILAGVLGIFVLAGVVFGAYKLGQKQIQLVPSPTPTLLPSEVSMKEGDPTANWKTYTNTVGKYSLKIPQIYDIAEMPGGGFSSGMDEVWFGTNQEVVGKTFFIAVYDSSDPQRFEPEANFPDAEIIEIIVDGVYGKKQMRDDRFNQFSGGNQTQQLFFEHKNRVIFIYFSAESQSQIELFDQILSTFRFLE